MKPQHVGAIQDYHISTCQTRIRWCYEWQYASRASSNQTDYGWNNFENVFRKKELQVSIDTKNSALDIAFYLGYVARCLNAVTSSAVHVISRVLYTDGLQLS